MIAEDEFAGAVGTGQCPNGGVHVFETTGALERNPEKVGYWNIDTVGPTDAVEGRCTAHVFDIHEDEKVMTIAYYNGGVHVVDLSGLTGISLADQQVAGDGHEGDRLLPDPGRRVLVGQDAEIAPRRVVPPLRNDIERGLDVYRFTRVGRRPSPATGTWMGAKQAAAYFAGAAAGRASRAPTRSSACWRSRQGAAPRHGAAPCL